MERPCARALLVWFPEWLLNAKRFLPVCAHISTVWAGYDLTLHHCWDITKGKQDFSSLQFLCGMWIMTFTDPSPALTRSGSRPGLSSIAASHLMKVHKQSGTLAWRSGKSKRGCTCCLQLMNVAWWILRVLFPEGVTVQDVCQIPTADTEKDGRPPSPTVEIWGQIVLVMSFGVQFCVGVTTTHIHPPTQLSIMAFHPVLSPNTKLTFRRTSAWWELHHVTETVFGKHFSVWPCGQKGQIWRRRKKWMSPSRSHFTATLTRSFSSIIYNDVLHGPLRARATRLREVRVRLDKAWTGGLRSGNKRFDFSATEGQIRASQTSNRPECSIRTSKVAAAVNKNSLTLCLNLISPSL